MEPAVEQQHHHLTNDSVNQNFTTKEMSNVVHRQQENYQNQHGLKDNFASLDDRNCISGNDMSDYGDDECDDDISKVTLDSMRYSNVRMGICSVCHFSLRGADASQDDFERALLCSEGHLLCHRCQQRFGIRSDTSCVLCAAADSEYSVVSASRSSSPLGHEPGRKIGHSRRDHLRRSPMNKKKSVASCTNLAPHYNFGNYIDEPWNHTEFEDDNDEDDDEEEVIPQVSVVRRQKSGGSLMDGKKTTMSSDMKSQINVQMMAECSRRPIQCPRVDCAVNVAFSALTNHFIFDHPEVPILTVSPGEKITLIVNFDGLDYDSSRCLALLLVADKLSGPAARQFNGNCIRPEYKNRLPLPILAARLHCSESKNSKPAAGEGNQDVGDIIIAWVAGLDIGNSTAGALRCSIQAIDSIEGESYRSLTYTGPINSLRTAQKPREVFVVGDCVILHDGFIDHITSGSQSLNVNIIIH